MGFLGKKAVNRGGGAGGNSNRVSPIVNVVKSILCDIRLLAERWVFMRLLRSNFNSPAKLA